jgi:uncharacterized UPF0160 family protein
VAGAEFTERVEFYGKSWWPARKYIQQAVDKRFEVDASGEIVDLTMCETNLLSPWKEHLFALEEEMDIKGHIKFVLFTDSYGKWRVQGVPPSTYSFDLRVPLHPEWQGLRDNELSTKSGIPLSIFVHATGFIGGNNTREGVLEMAQKSIKYNVAQT